MRFATRSGESSLAQASRIGRAPRRGRTSFFLRAESSYDVATEVERLASTGSRLLHVHVGTTARDRSHGDSFLDLLIHGCGPADLYLLDEPEAALSIRGCLAALARIDDRCGRGRSS